jgi:hypothetical protein
MGEFNYWRERSNHINQAEDVICFIKTRAAAQIFLVVLDPRSQENPEKRNCCHAAAEPTSSAGDKTKINK